jgi:nicotinamide-nucleotide amidase
MYNTSMIDRIRDKMMAAHQTIAVAESVTSGHLQAALSLANNASLFYQGGITVYNLGQKSRHLAIDPIQAEACDSVSEPVANTMALNVCHLFISNWGIGITGYATPIPEQNINELFAYFSIAYNGKIVVSKKITSNHKTPADVQLFYVETVLKELEALAGSTVQYQKNSSAFA